MNREAKAENTLELICLFLCGLSLLGILIGMIANFADTIIMISGIVMFVSMVTLVYKSTKNLSPYNC